MRVFAKIALCAAAPFLLAACSSTEVPEVKKAPAASYKLGEKQLLEILDSQSRLLEYLARNPGISEGELKSKVTKIEDLWGEYIRANPKDVNALILFGKFLRAMHDPNSAYEAFTRADEVNPNIAVVKQQMATYEGENKNYAAAYANLKRACELEPKTAVYHYQLAELLYLAGAAMEKSGAISAEDCEAEMKLAYKNASECAPSNRDFALRYAQSFYDMAKPDWNGALEAWNRALQISPLLHEKNYVLLNKGRVLILLERPADAKAELEKIPQDNANAELISLMLQANTMLEKSENEASENKKAFTY